jgi:Ca-activated chloride channel family protein
MNFAHPLWLAVGAVALAGLLWVWRYHDAQQRKTLARFVSPHLQAALTQSVSGARRTAKRALFAAALILLSAALAGPQAGFRWEQVKRRGNDIIFAVDTSRSMATPDVKPNRLARAQLAIEDLLDRLNGDAVGLVAFAGSAFLQCPITLDYGAFRESLAALDTRIIPRGSTNITSAIHAAETALQRRPNSDKVLILLTDGEDLEGDSVAAAKTAAKQDGLKIFTVGVGSADGDLIPLPADQGGGFLKDRAGRLVKSRLDEPALMALAAATGGAYAPLGVNNQGLDAIYQDALAPLAKHDLESRSQKIYTERYQWPLAASLVLLLGSLLIGTRRRFTTRKPAAVDSRHLRRSAIPTAAALFGLSCWVLPINAARASPASAATAYQHGDFATAARDYLAAAQRDPTQPVLQFDAGAAAYKVGEFPQAAQAFQASLNAAKSGSSRRLAEQEDAYYNLGNTLYRVGQKTEQGNAPETIRSWAHAVNAYDAALQLRPSDVDVKFNRDLVNRKLEELKKAQPPQNQSKQSSGTQQSQAQGGQEPQSKAQPSEQPQPESEQPKRQPQQAQPHPGGERSDEGQDKFEESPPVGPKNEPTVAANGAAPRPDLGRGSTNSGNHSTGPADEDQRMAGGMSPQEARDLLDSVKDEERLAPAAPVARNGADKPASDEPLKDW